MALRRYYVKKGKISENNDTSDVESFEYPHDAIDYLHENKKTAGEIYDNTFKEIVILYNLETGDVATREVKKGDVQLTYAANLHHLAMQPVADAISLCVKRKLLRELEAILQDANNLNHHKNKAVKKIIDEYFGGETKIENKELYKAHKRLDVALKKIRETLSPPLLHSFNLLQDERTHAQKAIHKVLTKSKPHDIKCEKKMRDILNEIKKEIEESKHLSSSAQTRTHASTRKHRK